MEPYRWFGWQATDEAGQPVWTFVFGLFPEGEDRTRLVVRESFAPAFMPPLAVIALEIPEPSGSATAGTGRMEEHAH